MIKNKNFSIALFLYLLLPMASYGMRALKTTKEAAKMSRLSGRAYSQPTSQQGQPLKPISQSTHPGPLTTIKSERKQAITEKVPTTEMKQPSKAEMQKAAEGFKQQMTFPEKPLPQTELPTKQPSKKSERISAVRTSIIPPSIVNLQPRTGELGLTASFQQLWELILSAKTSEQKEEARLALIEEIRNHLEDFNKLIQKAKSYGFDIESFEKEIVYIDIYGDNLKLEMAQDIVTKFSNLEPDLKKAIESKNLLTQLEDLIKKIDDLIEAKDIKLNSRELESLNTTKNMANLYKSQTDIKIFKDNTEFIRDKFIKLLMMLEFKEADQVKIERLEAEQEAKKQEKLRLAEKAAEEKAAAELAKLDEEKSKEELNILYDQLEKESTIEEELAEEAVTTEQEKKQLELKEISTSKEEEQKELEIADLEKKQEQLEREQQEAKEKMEQTKKEIAEKTATHESELQKEQEAFEAREKIESEQRKEALEKITAERLQTEQEASEAEQKAQEEQKKYAESLIQLQQAETNLQLKEKSLASNAQEIEQLEKELKQLKGRTQQLEKEMKEAQSNFANQQKEIEAKAQTELEQLNQDTAIKLQQAKDNLQKSKDFINKTAEEQTAALKALEIKSNEETKIKQQSIEKEKSEKLTRIDTEYEQALKPIEAELEQLTEQLKIERAIKTLQSVSKISNPELTQQAIDEATRLLQAAEKALKPKDQALTIEQATKILQSAPKINNPPSTMQAIEQAIETLQEKLIAEETKIEPIKPEVPKIEQKEKTGGQGGGELPKKIEKVEETKKEKEKAEEETQKKPGALEAALLLGALAAEEKEKEEGTIAEKVIPEITPEVVTIKAKEITPSITPETIYQPTLPQATEEAAPVIPSPMPMGTTQSAQPLPTPKITPAAEAKTTPFKPSIPSGGITPSSATSVENIPSTGRITPYQQRPGGYIQAPQKETAPSPEIKKEKKLQPQPTVWWEKILPNWVVQYLGRKERTIKEQPKVVKPAPVAIAEEEKVEKPSKKEAGVLKTIIETIKKPVTNAINYIRQLFAPA